MLLHLRAISITSIRRDRYLELSPSRTRNRADWFEWKVVAKGKLSRQSRDRKFVSSTRRSLVGTFSYVKWKKWGNHRRGSDRCYPITGYVTRLAVARSRIAFSDSRARPGSPEEFAQPRRGGRIRAGKRSTRLRLLAGGFEGNSQVGRKYVIRNLVSHCSIVVLENLAITREPRIPALPYSPSHPLFLSPLSLSRSPPAPRLWTNVEFYFASRGRPPAGPVARRYFYSNFARSVLS